LVATNPQAKPTANFASGNCGEVRSNATRKADRLQLNGTLSASGATHIHSNFYHAVLEQHRQINGRAERVWSVDRHHASAMAIESRFHCGFHEQRRFADASDRGAMGRAGNAARIADSRRGAGRRRTADFLSRDIRHAVPNWRSDFGRAARGSGDDQQPAIFIGGDPTFLAVPTARQVRRANTQWTGETIAAMDQDIERLAAAARRP
jgi:hypothetical protein